jgi:hypothetical protein
VSVRRGSTTITVAPWAWRSLMRPQTIGWHAAVFDPISRKQLAASMSAYDGGGPSAPNAAV